jgi:hypothetical protein
MRVSLVRMLGRHRSAQPHTATLSEGLSERRVVGEMAMFCQVDGRRMHPEQQSPALHKPAGLELEANIASRHSDFFEPSKRSG